MARAPHRRILNERPPVQMNGRTGIIAAAPDSVWTGPNGAVFLGCAEYSMQDQRLQKHSFAPKGSISDKSSSGQSRPKSKGTARLIYRKCHKYYRNIKKYDFGCRLTAVSTPVK